MTAQYGFGCYRVNVANPVHEAAMRHAITSGISVIDTSTNYGNGASEQLVGKVLHSGLAHRPLIITKLGYAQGAVLELVNQRKGAGEPYEDVVDVGDGIKHCISRDFLTDVFKLSLSRLGSESVDVLLLHNPEYFLQVAHTKGMPIAEARTEFYRRIRNAFEWMEEQRHHGRIKSYGISSNTFANYSDDPDFVSLDMCIVIARKVGGSENAFKYIQLPFNIIEHFAATTLNQSFVEGTGFTQTVLERSKNAGIDVVVNRPLNAIINNDIIRLVSHILPNPDSASAPEYSAIETRVHELEIAEHEILQKIIAAQNSHHVGDESIRKQTTEIFSVAGSLCQTWNKFDGLIHWRDVRRSYLDPRITHAATYSSGEDVGLAAYIKNVTDLLNNIDTMYAAEENVSLESLRTRMADEFNLPANTPLQHIALHALRCTEGVSVVLVGMRTPDYVDDVLKTNTLQTKQFTRENWQRVSQALAELSAN